MKLFAIVFLSLFATATAFSCPDLSGTYQCEKDSGDPSDTGIIVLATDNSSGQTVYNWTDKDDGQTSALPTDGQTYQDGDSSYTGSCSGNNFNIVITGVDETVGAYTANMAYSLDASKNLASSGVIKFNYQDQPYSQNFTNSCTRL